ncbi:hypothetical protein F4821DRAFT_238021 [Hypoxylon rubiginosum]|uniref:Uncharacterized protein n=1 Tax=Hypoxylon rubiginosum TaxID=110542 RepID=A0ACC0D1I2_9PEZI|nr:hypothetical protein F4821DRAFT_238021 [Hypoxylon rubiginosum]
MAGRRSDSGVMSIFSFFGRGGGVSISARGLVSILLCTYLPTYLFIHGASLVSDVYFILRIVIPGCDLCRIGKVF